MRVFAWGFEKKNIYSFHAGTFVFNNKGFLISSEYPAGKSTISLLAAKSGGYYINDEYSFAKLKEGIPYIFGIPEMGAHIRIGTRKKMGINYSHQLSQKYIQHTDTEIFPIEIDDTLFNVIKEWGDDRVKHSHKLDVIFFLDTSPKNKKCTLEKIDFKEGVQKLMISSAKHPFKLLNLEDSILSRQQSKPLEKILIRELNFDNQARKQFMEKLLSKVVFYRLVNNLNFDNISDILEKV